MIDLYVYYKVRVEHAAPLAPLVRALQARVAAGLTRAQLKCRPDTKDGLQTWMEVYPCVPEHFPEALASAALGAGLEGLIEGPRRAEVFMELPLCA